VTVRPTICTFGVDAHAVTIRKATTAATTL